MDKERVKQALNKKHPGYESVVAIVLDAIELSRQDDGAKVGSLVVCPRCKGKGQVPNAKVTGMYACCDMCKGYGSVKVECNTPSA